MVLNDTSGPPVGREPVRRYSIHECQDRSTHPEETASAGKVFLDEESILAPGSPYDRERYHKEAIEMTAGARCYQAFVCSHT
jgi:hypothetical protein